MVKGMDIIKTCFKQKKQKFTWKPLASWLMNRKRGTEWALMAGDAKNIKWTALNKIIIYSEIIIYNIYKEMQKYSAHDANSKQLCP